MNTYYTVHAQSHEPAAAGQKTKEKNKSVEASETLI